MARVMFTGNLKAHADAAPAEAPGATVREVLENVFKQRPQLRGYVLDDQGAVRRHVVVFVGNEPVKDRQHLSDPATSEIAVMQALSGG